MTGPQYRKGRRKEYKISKELRDEGYEIVQRTAGSHSPVDIFAINKLNKRIKFVQAKPDDFNPKKLLEEFKWLEGYFYVTFEVR